MRFVVALLPPTIGSPVEYEILEKCRKLNPQISKLKLAAS
jgi:hypothetical protein